jgi:hypothetical protein
MILAPEPPRSSSSGSSSSVGNPSPFKLERYFGVHEFTAKVLLSSSDVEALSVHELL